jgi:adenine-specific DNA-methyltransferase
VTAPDPSCFLPWWASRDDPPQPIATAHALPSEDLFGSTGELIGALLAGGDIPASLETAATAFVTANGFAVTCDLAAVRPSHLQCLLAELAHMRNAGGSAAPTQQRLDPAAGLSLWSRGDAAGAAEVERLWRTISLLGTIDGPAALSTPWLYGNKLRLTRFIAPVAAISLPESVPVLDLMSGTGIVGRALSDRFVVHSNDPNPYAALLSSCQGVDATGIDTAGMKAALRPAYTENHEALSHLAARSLDEEGGLLHGDPDEVLLEQYARLSERAVLPVTDGTDSPVARLATERYANVYFGVSQAIEADSLRQAIDAAYPSPGRERTLSLAALIIACTTCATGPHFAQPTRPSSLKALRTAIERRARSLAWEFDLALNRLVTRRPPAHGFARTTSTDWRVALQGFAAGVTGRPAGVYVDPPYSKLQYSRYYHVLNVLLAYDYPPVAGSGRYPPRSHRFSSRFEYQPAAAKRELSALIEMAASFGLTTMLSYGDAGFIGIDDLGATMRTAFKRVEIFSEELRHHSQGRPIANTRGAVREYLLVGHPNERRVMSM